ISPEECESLFAWVHRRTELPGPIVTTTEAPHYRRVVMQATHGRVPRHGAGIRDGNGVMFIAHDGTITPSGFLPIVAGDARSTHPGEVYRRAPLFVMLRDPRSFEGKCGRCEYHTVCGGSRARAYAATGNPLASDPLCSYEPGGGATSSC